MFLTRPASSAAGFVNRRGACRRQVLSAQTFARPIHSGRELLSATGRPGTAHKAPSRSRAPRGRGSVCILLRSSSGSLGMATATDPLAATGEQSPLRGGLLALLVQGPSYGYELANRLERQLGPDWRIVRSSLYRTLKAMCAEGLLSAEKSEAAEARIVYSATGRADGAVQSWMESPLSLEDGQLQ